MAAVSQISIADYLRGHYEPACELVGGVLSAKPMGTLDHMNLEKRLMRLLEPFEVRRLGKVMHELSCRIGDDVRIPDLVFFAPNARFQDGVLIDPPLLAVEILSPSQKPSALFAKCETYHAWGVPYCWVIDQLKKAAWEYNRDGSIESKTQTLTAGEIALALVELFA